jgi:hypothetical protein
MTYPNTLTYSAFIGVASCVGLLALFYNVVALIMFMREDSEGSASMLAKASWAVGLLSLMFAGLPCFGLFLPLVAIIMSRLERGRIYRDESPLAGATPVRMGSVNGGIAVLIVAIMSTGLIAALAMGS